MLCLSCEQESCWASILVWRGGSVGCSTSTSVQCTRASGSTASSPCVLSVPLMWGPSKSTVMWWVRGWSFMSVCVCTYLCPFVCASVCVPIRKYVCVCFCFICVYMFPCMCVRACTCMHACVCACMSACLFVWVCYCSCMYANGVCVHNWPLFLSLLLLVLFVFASFLLSMDATQENQ